MSDAKKPWQGRFTEATDAFVEAFTASIGFDHRLYRYDIEGSRAHARTLERAGILSQEECMQILAGLDGIDHKIEQGKFKWSVALEDVHMNIEAHLVEQIGSVGKKLHTGRSRNDQVSTDLRLYLRDEINKISDEIRYFQLGLLDVAEREADTLMPGFTHLQVAQPVTFGHHMMAWFEMLDRDHARLTDCQRRVNIMPLGSAALAGTSFPLDRTYTAGLLGFTHPSANSLDAVSDRDFVVEFCAVGAILMAHLSRMAEELILWASGQFNFVRLPDRFCTGSSIMPQKKNPDVPELVRGKSGRVFGHLMALLTLIKAQPLAYNKDNQEDKEPLFDTVDTLHNTLRAFADLIPVISVQREVLYAAAQQGFATATDFADYLVRKGIAFRDAHEVVGHAVQLALMRQCALDQLPLEELKRLSPAIEADVYSVLTLEGSVNSRNILGGTAPAQVRYQIQAARKRLKPQLS